MNQMFTNRWLICRICLKSENKTLYNIFESITDEDISDLGNTLQDKIELFGGVKLTQQHNLPNKICNRCVLLLRAANKFRNLCKQSSNQLKEFISPIPEEEPDETLEINFDSDEDEQKANIEEEISSGVLTDLDYVVQDSVMEYDGTTEKEQNFVAKSEYITTINENDDVEIQDISDDENSQYVMEDVIGKELTSHGHDDKITTFKYEDETNSDSIFEEMPKKRGNQIYLKSINELKPNVSKRRRSSQSECFKGIYSCRFCDNTYTDKTKYNNHMKIHIKDKPHECEICKKRFSTTPQLSRHMNSHTGNRPYKCQYCEASFGDPSTKIKHERIHTNERPYKCCLCDKSFAYSNVLKVHTMTHTGEKPHTCEHCGKQFSQLHHKKAHEKRHTKVNMVLLKNSLDIEYMEEDDLKEYKIVEIT